MRSLADHSSHTVMKAISREDKDEWPKDDGGNLIALDVLEAIKKAEEEKEKYNYQVSVFLQNAQILNNRESAWLGLTDGDAEIYVVSLAVDLTANGGDAIRDSSGINLNANVSLPDGVSQQIFEGITRTASGKFVVRSTPLFHHIRERDSLPLLGNGIPLYEPKDPKGFLGLYVAIMEDDKGYRNLGKIIEEVAKKVKINDIIDKALQFSSLGDPKVFALKSAFKLLFHGVTIALQDNKDDIVQEIVFSSLAHQNYCAGVIPFDYKGARGNLLVVVQNTPKE